MVCLSHSSYGMSRLASLMNALFRERRDFHVSFSDRDMSGSVWNRPPWSSVVDMGISSNTMKSPSPKCYMPFWDMIIYSDTLLWSNISQIVTLLPNWTLLPFWCYLIYLIPRGFHRTLATDAASQQRTLTPPDIWACPIWYLHLFSSWNHSFLNCHVYGPFQFRTSLGTSILPTIINYEWPTCINALFSWYVRNICFLNCILSF